MHNNKKQTEIKVGISTCLLGHKVRWDGGHKHDRFITNILGQYFQFIHFCPEVEAGMTVPREPVRLEGDVEKPEMVGSKTGKNWTMAMKKTVGPYINKMSEMNLSGYILKKDSPSCGMERVKVYPAGSGMAVRKGRGFFGAAVQNAFPLLPVEEEGRLNDPVLRENFIVRVFAYHRLQTLFNGKYNRGEIVKFHSIHKYLLMAHSPKHYKSLGQLVAAIKDYSPSEFKREYSKQYMDALKLYSTVKKNVNVLQHILGYLKKDLSSEDKSYIIQTIDDYHRQLVPLIVPMTMIKHYIYKYKVDYIMDQIYLNPHPKELMLRNHV